MQQLTAPFINGLVALSHPSHGQGRVHVVVMTGQVETNKALEEKRPARPGAAKKDEQAGGRAAVGDHIENRPELGALLEVARGDAIEGIEEAGDAVEEGTGPWVEGHVVEGGEGEDYTGVAYERGFGELDQRA